MCPTCRWTATHLLKSCREEPARMESHRPPAGFLPGREHSRLARARCASRVAAVGAGPSLFQVRAVARTETTHRTLQQHWKLRCVFPRSLHQEVQDRKPPVNEHKRVLFSVITLPQAALPLGRSACNHASESLDTGSAGLIASGANNRRSHSGRVSRLVPFVVALRQHGRATGCQPVSERIPTALPGRRRTIGPTLSGASPRNTAPALAGLLPPHGLPRG